MTITIVGHGYVGLVSAAVFAELGNTVHVIGHTKEKIDNLKKGIIPIYEPGLEELVLRNVKNKRLLFSLEYKPAISESEVVFIAVGTPPKENGEADLKVVYEVAEKIASNIENNQYLVVVTKSTVPVGTNFNIKNIISKIIKNKSSFDVASVPEFLREGQAIGDTRHPDRIIIGTQNAKSREVLNKLHEPITNQIINTNIPTAEMIKYASNAFLATKISFANAIATLSEKVDADGPEVLKAMGLDKRIGTSFLNPGAGYGGSCFPKDVKALIQISKNNNYDFRLLQEVENINVSMMENIVNKAKSMLNNKIENKNIAVLGIAFKPDTDDIRDAPSLFVIKKLLDLGAKIKAFDPAANPNASRVFKNKNISISENEYECVRDAELIIVMTEWDIFREMDLKKVKSLVKKSNILDGRNIYSPSELKDLGFTYVGVGR